MKVKQGFQGGYSQPQTSQVPNLTTDSKFCFIFLNSFFFLKMEAFKRNAEVKV